MANFFEQAEAQQAIENNIRLFLEENAVALSLYSYYNPFSSSFNMLLLSSSKRDEFFELLMKSQNIYLHGSSKMNKEFLTSFQHGLIVISNFLIEDKDTIKIKGFKVLKPEVALEFSKAGAFFAPSSFYAKQCMAVTSEEILENLARIALEKKKEAEEKAKYENSIEELRIKTRATTNSLEVFDNLWKRVRSLDLFYDYSDDRNVWKAGEQNEKQLASELNAIGVSSSEVFRQMRAIQTR